MKSFFESVRSLFKQGYHGRYFAYILRELARSEPESFGRILGAVGDDHSLWSDVRRWAKDGRLAADCEKAFKGTKKKRRKADLALSLGLDPVVFIEVKEFDGKNPTNALQTADYLSRVSHAQGRLGFIYIYRFRPNTEDFRKLERSRDKGRPVASLRYDDIYRCLKDAPGPLAQLICRYLRGIGVGVYQNINLRNKAERKSAQFLLVQMLAMPHKTGLKRLQSSASATGAWQLIGKLLGNIEVLGEWCREGNEKVLPTRFQRRFYVEPHFDFEPVKSALSFYMKDKQKKKETITAAKLGKDLVDYLNGDEIVSEGGQVHFSASGPLKAGRATLAIGFRLDIRRNVNAVPVYAYAEIEAWDKKLEKGLLYEKLSSFPDEENAYRIFSQLIRRVLRAAAPEIKKLPVEKSLKNFTPPKAVGSLRAGAA